MVEQKIIDETELIKVNPEHNSTLANKINTLFLHQKENWEMFKQGWIGFQSSQVKKFHFNSYEIKVQYNPTRFISSSAKVDARSIAERKCFLCPKNLPEEQKGLLFRNLLILCNPAPIFNEHYTIANTEHTKQEILPNLELMLDLTYELKGRYTIFYNGPKCGASAPDHFHFQSAPTDHLITEFEIKHSEDQLTSIIKNKDIIISYFPNYFRNILVINSTDKTKVIEHYESIYSLLQKINNTIEEPLHNIMTFYHNNSYYLVVFPRDKHRPDIYFKEGDEKMLISPGLVDMAGTLITPIEKDFNSINENIIKTVFKEVTISDEKFFELVKTINK